MPDIFPVTPAKAQPRPPISRSLHGEFIEQAIPDWLINATQARRDAFRAGTLQSPSWYRQASTVQRQALHTQAVASFAYPFGIYGDEDVALAREAGYTTAVTTIDGIDARTPRPDPLQLKRIKVSGKDNMLAFVMRMRGGKRGWKK